MIPFYIFYSMFGFQRTGDQFWAFGDARGRGFLLGATAGRTTLNGEGLQHEDGHSLVLASTIPNIRAYDPAFAYEMAVIVRDGIERMYGSEAEDVFYYLTLYNENCVQPAKPEGVDEGILRGLYGSGPLRPAPDASSCSPRARSAAGAARAGDPRREVRRGGRRLVGHLLPAAAQRRARGRALEPAPPRRRSSACRTCASASRPSEGPIVAATDYLKAVPDMVARWIDRPYTVLGTDGFGRSDTREALRDHFEVNAEHIAYAALHGLCLDWASTPEELSRAIGELGIDPERVNPLHA